MLWNCPHLDAGRSCPPRLGTLDDDGTLHEHASGLATDPNVIDAEVSATNADECAPLVTLRHETLYYRRMHPEEGFPLRILARLPDEDPPLPIGTMATTYFGNELASSTTDSTWFLVAVSAMAMFPPSRYGQALECDTDVALVLRLGRWRETGGTTKVVTSIRRRRRC